MSDELLEVQVPILTTDAWEISAFINLAVCT